MSSSVAIPSPQRTNADPILSPLPSQAQPPSTSPPGSTGTSPSSALLSRSPPHTEATRAYASSLASFTHAKFLAARRDYLNAERKRNERRESSPSPPLERSKIKSPLQTREAKASEPSASVGVKRAAEEEQVYSPPQHPRHEGKNGTPIPSAIQRIAPIPPSSSSNMSLTRPNHLQATSSSSFSSSSTSVYSSSSYTSSSSSSPGLSPNALVSGSFYTSSSSAVSGSSGSVEMKRISSHVEPERLDEETSMKRDGSMTTLKCAEPSFSIGLSRRLSGGMGGGARDRY